MPRYVKNEKGYEKSFKADWKAVSKGLKKARAERGEPKKVPTSVALDPRFVAELKKEADARGIPYQILMRMFIIEGFQRMKKAG
ncbi:MAG: CopG antitoxin of type toxin-antitoxin system [Pseudomonadota bacterium]|jgi:predicted DNA binding CopG/RHH family protein